MQTSSRLYQCLRCHIPVVICHRCDHGQRYCANGCSKKARMVSQKRASEKYQTTRAGRFNNAARQQRFRNRQKQFIVIIVVKSVAPFSGTVSYAIVLIRVITEASRCFLLCF